MTNQFKRVHSVTVSPRVACEPEHYPLIAAFYCPVLSVQALSAQPLWEWEAPLSPWHHSCPPHSVAHMSLVAHRLSDYVSFGRYPLPCVAPDIHCIGSCCGAKYSVWRLLVHCNHHNASIHPYSLDATPYTVSYCWYSPEMSPVSQCSGCPQLLLGLLGLSAGWVHMM